MTGIRSFPCAPRRWPRYPRDPVPEHRPRRRPARQLDRAHTRSPRDSRLPCRSVRAVSRWIRPARERWSNSSSDLRSREIFPKTAGTNTAAHSGTGIPRCYRRLQEKPVGALGDGGKERDVLRAECRVRSPWKVCMTASRIPFAFSPRARCPTPPITNVEVRSLLPTIRQCRSFCDHLAAHSSSSISGILRGENATKPIVA